MPSDELPIAYGLTVDEAVTPELAADYSCRCGTKRRSGSILTLACEWQASCRTRSQCQIYFYFRTASSFRLETCRFVATHRSGTGSYAQWDDLLFQGVATMAVQIRRNMPSDAVQGRTDSPDATRATHGARARSKRLLPGGAVLQSLRQMTGLLRSSPARPQRAPLAKLPAISSTVQEDLVGDTVKWISQQNGSAVSRPQGIRSLTRDQALAAGKPVPTRAPPPPPAGNAASSTDLDDDDDLMELETASGKIITAARPEPAPPSAATQTLSGTGPTALHRQPGHGPLGPHRARSSWKPDLATIHEEKHESGPLRSLGTHYEEIMRQLRNANTQAQNALTQPKIPLFASTKKKRAALESKRGELQQHSAVLSRLLDESGSAAVDEKTVHQLSRKGHREIPASQILAVDRDIAETLRQRRHVQKTLETVHKWIAEIDRTLA